MDLVSKEKINSLHERMERLNIRESDLIEKFILGTGKGGQKINKTSSTVYLKHIPSGIEVKCGQERSREQNRFFARRKLVEILEKEILNLKTKKEQEAEKIRRQKRRKSRRQKEKMIEEKRELSKKKEMRSIKREE